MDKCNRWLVGVGLMAMLFSGCTREAAHPQAPSASPGQSASAARVVHLYNWADYIDPAVIADFEKTTGIKVTEDVFDSQDMLETKLLTGGSGYDVAVVASDKLPRLVAAGVLQKRDYTLLPSSRNLDPELHAALARIDPETAAKLRPSDPQRIARAMEVILKKFSSSSRPCRSAIIQEGWARQMMSVCPSSIWLAMASK